MAINYPRLRQSGSEGLWNLQEVPGLSRLINPGVGGDPSMDSPAGRGMSRAISKPVLRSAIKTSTHRRDERPTTGNPAQAIVEAKSGTGHPDLRRMCGYLAASLAAEPR
jgi:hypothetical protein